MLTWKYTLPAFLVPFVFTLKSEGMGVLLQAPPATVAVTSLSAALGVAALAVGAGGWLRQRATAAERLAAIVAGLLLMYPAFAADLAGVALFGAVGAAHYRRTRAGV